MAGGAKRIKVTGYYTPDAIKFPKLFDGRRSSGLSETGEAFVQETFLGLEDLEYTMEEVAS